MKNKRTPILFPNIWGEGIIFAYSGIDGKTDWQHPFVAAALSSPVGLLFHTDPERKIIFRGAKLKGREDDIVTSDFVFCPRPLFSLLFLDKDTLIGECEPSIVPQVPSGKGIAEERDENRILQCSRGSFTALAWTNTGDRIKFAYAFDAKNIRNALRKAEKGLKANLRAQKEKRLTFFAKLPRPKLSNVLLERTYYKAFSVLKVNVESPQGKIKCRWTTPDRFPHKDMWLWDSAFHSLGSMHISHSLAEDTIKAVLSTQRKDGFIAHQMNPKRVRASVVTQPPILTWASWKIYQEAGNKGFLKYAYPRLKKFMLWLCKNRDRNKRGLLEWKISPSTACKCGESGMDNSPRFDNARVGESMKAIDLNCFAINDMGYLEKMALKLDKKEDAVFWQRERERRKDLVNRCLWDEKDRFYYDLNENNEFNRIKTPASFLPLLAGIADKRQAGFLVKHLKNPREFWTKLPVPSVSLDEPSYCKDMWRGPTWINYNYLVIEGLKRYGFTAVAQQLAEKTLREIAQWYGKKGAIFEYYDCEGKISPDKLMRKEWLGTKKAMGVIRDYHWSAAVCVALSQGSGT